MAERPGYSFVHGSLGSRGLQAMIRQLPESSIEWLVATLPLRRHSERQYEAILDGKRRRERQKERADGDPAS